MQRNKKIIPFLILFITASILAGTGVKDFFYAGNVLAEDPPKEAAAKEEGKADQGEAGKDGEAPPCPECPECPDPAKVVLKGLEEKKQHIEEESKEIARQRKDLEKYEEQIDEKLASLEALKKQIQDDMALLEQKKTQKELQEEQAYEAQMAKLVKMYAGMKPKSAALIVDKMSLETAQEIFSRMREASASDILSYVESEKAAKISEYLAFKQTP